MELTLPPFPGVEHMIQAEPISVSHSSRHISRYITATQLLTVSMNLRAFVGPTERDIDMEIRRATVVILNPLKVCLSENGANTM